MTDLVTGGGKRNNQYKICDWGMLQYFLYDVILTKICLNNSLKHSEMNIGWLRTVSKT